MNVPAIASVLPTMNTLIAFRFLLVWLLLINVLTFFVFGADKWKARHKAWRIPEKTLFILALIGGSMGALLGMKCFHHKTLHRTFTMGIPVILALQLVLLLWGWLHV